MRYARLEHAGIYFPKDFTVLIGIVRGAFLHPKGPRQLPSLDGKVVAGRRGYLVFVAPHAPIERVPWLYGYTYYYMLVEGVPETVIILGPDHYGATNGPVTVIDAGFMTPVSTLSTDDDVVELLVKRAKYYSKGGNVLGLAGPGVFAREHSIEVHLAILGALVGPDVKVVPIIVPHYVQTHIDAIGKAIADVIVEGEKDIAVIASTDMSHYGGDRVTVEEADKKALDMLMHGWWKELAEMNKYGKISWCGLAAVATAVKAALSTGARRARLLGYHLEKTSGGWNSYASVVFYRV